jgi:hypothetical protein
VEAYTLERVSTASAGDLAARDWVGDAVRLRPAANRQREKQNRPVIANSYRGVRNRPISLVRPPHRHDCYCPLAGPTARYRIGDDSLGQ